MVQICVKMEHGESTPSWTIIEVQGDLETRGASLHLSSSLIGNLHYTKSGVPVLIIGHHMLHGKVTDLTTPIAVLAKMKTESKTEYIVKAVVTKKLLFRTRPKPIITSNVLK